MTWIPIFLRVASRYWFLQCLLIVCLSSSRILQVQDQKPRLITKSLTSVIMVKHLSSYLSHSTMTNMPLDVSMQWKYFQAWVPPSPLHFTTLTTLPPKSIYLNKNNATYFSINCPKQLLWWFSFWWVQAEVRDLTIEWPTQVNNLRVPCHALTWPAARQDIDGRRPNMHLLVWISSPSAKL